MTRIRTSASSHGSDGRGGVAAFERAPVEEERLGQVSITLDTYSHVVGTLQREAAERIDELLE